MSTQRFEKNINRRVSVNNNLEENAEKTLQTQGVPRQERDRQKQRREKIKSMVDMVEYTDPPQKALTGRTPEIIEEETGIEKKEMFPEDKNILYIGDPWQRMGKIIDKENMYIVDYEYGEVASFITDEQEFFQSMLGYNFTERLRGDTGKTNAEKSAVKTAHDTDVDWEDDDSNDGYAYNGRMGQLLSSTGRILDLDKEDLPEKHQIWFENFQDYLRNAEKMTELAVQNRGKYDDYRRAADAWKDIYTYIEATYKQEMAEADQVMKDEIADEEYEAKNDGKAPEYHPNSDESVDEDDPWHERIVSFRKEAWYDGVLGERGFRDIADYNEVVLPQLEARRAKLESRRVAPDLINKEMAELEKSLIKKIRMVKKPKHAHILEAAFPDMPFEDETFDRIIASWSISAHTFNDLSESDLVQTWDEVDRLLKEKGRAYIFPMNWRQSNIRNIIDSLNVFGEKSGLRWMFLDSDGNETEYTGDANTLLIVKEYNREYQKHVAK